MPTGRSRAVIVASVLLVAAAACSNQSRSSPASSPDGQGASAAATASMTPEVRPFTSGAASTGSGGSASAPDGSVSPSMALPSAVGGAQGNLLRAALGSISKQALPAHPHLFFSAPVRHGWTTDVQTNRKVKSGSTWNYGLARTDALFTVWEGMPTSSYTLRGWTGEDLPWAITVVDDATNEDRFKVPRTLITVLGDDTHWAAIAKGYLAAARGLSVTDIRTTGSPAAPELIDASAAPDAGLVRPMPLAGHKKGWIVFAGSRADFDEVGAGGSLVDSTPIAKLVDCLGDQDVADIQSAFEPETGVALGIRSTEREDVLTLCLSPHERTPDEAAEVAATVLREGVTGDGKSWPGLGYRSATATLLTDGTVRVTLSFDADPDGVRRPGSQAAPVLARMVAGEVPGSFNVPACDLAQGVVNPVSRQPILDRLGCRR